MSFSAPTVPKPKIKAGWIYAIRDEDYLDQSISRYVKLGLTERTVAQRIRDTRQAILEGSSKPSIRSTSSS